MREKLYKKLTAEYKEYVEELRCTTPDIIIGSSEETAFYNSVLYLFEDGNRFDDEDMASLLKSDNLLETFYETWHDNIIASNLDNYLDMKDGYIQDIIEDTTRNLE